MLRLLHVVSYVPGLHGEPADILRYLRRLQLGKDAPRCATLLFCDLPDAPAQALPQDAPLIRALQSGVMSTGARTGCSIHLLVRRRQWSDAARQYLGHSQTSSCREVIAQLAVSGETQTIFEASTCTPSSLKGAYDAVLFSDAAHICTPDTPLRMLRMLPDAPGGILGAAIRTWAQYPETILARLDRVFPFTLSSMDALMRCSLSARRLCTEDAPTMYTADALAASLRTPAFAVPTAAGCFFLRKKPVTLRALFAEYRINSLKQTSIHLLLPFAQLLLLFLAAARGMPALAASALFPELWALIHPRQWPGVLLRMALLPLTAFVSADTLLCRRFARAPLFRLRIPSALISPWGAVFAGAVLLPLAVSGSQALTALLPVCLAWLGAPLLLPALESPTIERIPLTQQQQALLHSLAENAYFSAGQDKHASPALRMLAACAGCMLGLLEPDEAARQVQAQLVPGQAYPRAFDRAAALTAAQYIRERMSDCDAALRDLPARLESSVCAAALPDGMTHPIDALFLPLGPAKAMPQHVLTLPLTHPHTFLKRLALSGDAAPDSAAHFLALAAAALGHPFHALLMRSPVAAPYMLFQGT
ncbi:MAG: hypothetical protein IJB85_12375 [Clostridia bacterium]|nr:hypothetical protein [Clostridia bacterium]